MRKSRQIILLGVMLLWPCLSRTQVAGLSTLSLLKTPSSARAAALGVSTLSVFSPSDLNVGLDNPSLIMAGYNNRLALNYVGLFSGSKSGSVCYGRDFHRFGVFLFGVHFNSYGRFDGYDEQEVALGEFGASDVALSVSWGLNIDSNFSMGASFRPVLSQYESYTAFAVALNVAGSYVSDSKRFAATLQARNIGSQLATFDGTVEPLPFDLVASASVKAKNAPFRLFAQADNLTRWDLTYDDPLNSENTVDPYTGEPLTKPWYDGISDVVGKVSRHLSLGVELEVKKVFFVRVGYRFRQMAEMTSEDFTNLNISGFSYGFGIVTKRFDFSFARRNYHLGQAPNYLSLSLKL